jgi:methylglutaconyl-CoA hydratase
MGYLHLLLDDRRPIVGVTLNRPERHNAFDETLIAELTDCFTQLNQDATVRAIVLKGEGMAFCAGADLTWMGRMAGYSHDENVADARRMQQMFHAIARSPKVTIAQVHGAAIGGGAGLAAACDIAIAAQDARFAFSEVWLGLAPAVIAPFVLRKIGPGAARALFVTGERFSAETALQVGLVQQVVPTVDLKQTVEFTAEAVLQTGPEAVAAVKLLLDALAAAPENADALTVECIAALRVSPEGQEGIRAFLEKRQPNFKDILSTD